MATKFVSGNRVFGQPEIDGGTFDAPNPVDNVLVVARTFRVETGWTQQVASAGAVSTETDGASLLRRSPAFSIYNTLTSAGLSIVASQLSGGRTYAWGTFGVGG